MLSSITKDKGHLTEYVNNYPSILKVVNHASSLMKAFSLHVYDEHKFTEDLPFDTYKYHKYIKGVSSVDVFRTLVFNLMCNQRLSPISKGIFNVTLDYLWKLSYAEFDYLDKTIKEIEEEMEKNKKEGTK